MWKFKRQNITCYDGCIHFLLVPSPLHMQTTDCCTNLPFPPAPADVIKFHIYYAHVANYLKRKFHFAQIYITEQSIAGCAGRGGRQLSEFVGTAIWYGILLVCLKPWNVDKLSWTLSHAWRSALCNCRKNRNLSRSAEFLMNFACMSENFANCFELLTFFPPPLPALKWKALFRKNFQLKYRAMKSGLWDTLYTWKIYRTLRDSTGK